jgi:hypothetical protein
MWNDGPRGEAQLLSTGGLVEWEQESDRTHGQLAAKAAWGIVADRGELITGDVAEAKRATIGGCAADRRPGHGARTVNEPHARGRSYRARPSRGQGP